jgi:DNA (cytosine-5)-methyltransferase 1
MSQRIDTILAGSSIRAQRESLGLSQSELAQKAGYSLKTISRYETGKAQPRRAVFETLRALHIEAAHRSGGDAFRFIDLFAGIGGLRLGFERAGGKCVFTSEWDKWAQITYRTNFGSEHPIAGDIVQIASDAIPKHDVLLAGFPCQPFSIAGVSKKNALGRPHGFACDTQGTLFFEVARILAHHRPRAFVLENVKNLVGHDKGRTFRTIRAVLTEELGYHVSWRVIDARSFLPQHRERIFIVGFRDTADFSLADLELPSVEDGPKLRTILHPEDGSETPEPPFTDEKGQVAGRYRLSDHLWDYLQRYAEKHRAKGNGFGYGLVGPDDVARTLSARYYKDGSEVLIRRRRGNPRRLTPRECARLMGFDRPGQPLFKIPVSDTQAYRQFGNSVAVPVVEAVARHMLPYLAGRHAARDIQLDLLAAAS